jgi:signal transduction histidine kinase
MNQPLKIVLVALAIIGSFLISQQNFLLFHSVAEVFSIVIAGGIFMIAWNARSFLRNDYLMLMGVAYLYIAGIDLLHTLAYQGMGVFAADESNLPTQLWIAARYLESFSLLAAPLFLRRPLKAERTLGVYALITLVLLLSIFVWDIFPDCFVEGEGLTTFKRLSEYIICAALLGALFLLFMNRRSFDGQVLRLLMGSILLTITAELAFTFYVHVYGFSNLVGHYLKIVSFYLIYRAIIVTGLTQPYALLLREVRDAQQLLVLANEDLERKVQERTVKLQETVADLEHFSYSIAHDMRAPLRCMSSFSSFLIEDNHLGKDATARDYLQRIGSAARRMDLLIRDVLSYSQLTRAEAQLAQVDLNSLVREIVRDYPGFQPDCVEIKIAGPLLPVIANAALLTICISNLIGNAIKFVAKGTKPQIRLWTESFEQGWVRFMVKDNGIGIEEGHLDRIWQMFERLHHEREYEGTGIGLSIVKRAVHRMNGKVGAESAPGKGSLFWIELKGAKCMAAGPADQANCGCELSFTQVSSESGACE